MIEVIDLSSAGQHGRKIDLGRVHAAGISAVYDRASDGRGWEDPDFESRTAAVLSEFGDAGAYHFLRVRHGRAQDAADQVTEFAQLYQKCGCTLIPALDCEPVPGATQEHNLATPEEWHEAIWSAQERAIHCFGKPFKVYTYPSFWQARNALAADSSAIAWDLWIADYGHVPEPRVPLPWGAESWFGWQYAAGAGTLGIVDGIPGYVDRSRFKCELDDLRL